MRTDPKKTREKESELYDELIWDMNEYAPADRVRPFMRFPETSKAEAETRQSEQSQRDMIHGDAQMASILRDFPEFLDTPFE